MNIWQLDPVNITPYYNIALCRGIAEHGHEVRYVTSKFLYDKDLRYPESFTTDLHYFRVLENEFLLRAPKLRRLLRAGLYPLQHRQLLRDLRREKPDVVHIQWSRLPVFDRWLVQHIRKLGIRVVHTIHDVEPLFAQGAFTGRLEDVYQQADALIVHTQDSRGRFLDHYPAVNAERIHIIPHLIPHVNPAGIPADASREAARRLLEIDPEVSMVLFFGIVKQYKGLDVLAKALPLFENQVTASQLWVVGRPDNAADKALLAKLDALKNVVVRSEFVPSEKLWQYYYAADVVVFPYRYIFQSGALMTALAYGSAVIVTDVGGLPELVDGNGWVIPPEDPSALADTIIDALSDRQRLAQMAQRSRELIAERYAPSTIAQQHLDLYEHLSPSVP